MRSATWMWSQPRTSCWCGKPNGFGTDSGSSKRRRTSRKSYLHVVIRSLLVHLAEEVLLMQPLKVGGITPFPQTHTLRQRKNPHIAAGVLFLIPRTPCSKVRNTSDEIASHQKVAINTLQQEDTSSAVNSFRPSSHVEDKGIGTCSIRGHSENSTCKVTR